MILASVRPPADRASDITWGLHRYSPFFAVFSWFDRRGRATASTQIAERVLDKPHGQNGGRFCAQNTRPQTNGPEALLLRSLLLLGRETALGSDEQEHTPGSLGLSVGKLVQWPADPRCEEK